MSPASVERRMAGRGVRLEHPVGSLTINLARFECGSDADEDVDILVVAVNLGRMALAAAEGALPEAKLIERICGDDPALLALPYLCFRERTRSEALSWNEAASSFADGLVASHSARCHLDGAAC